MSVRELFAESLRTYRAKAGLSQAELAKASGLSAGFIGEMEVGRKFPSAVAWEKLSDALGVRPYEFIYEPGSEDSAAIMKYRERVVLRIMDHLDTVH